MKPANEIPRVSEVIPSWNRDGEEVKEGGLHNTLQTNDQHQQHRQHNRRE